MIQRSPDLFYSSVYVPALKKFSKYEKKEKKEKQKKNFPSEDNVSETP